MEIGKMFVITKCECIESFVNIFMRPPLFPRCLEPFQIRILRVRDFFLFVGREREIELFGNGFVSPPILSYLSSFLF